MLENIKKYVTEIDKARRRGDGFNFSEADDELNEATREFIQACHECHGSCWLGIINRHDHRTEPNLWLYDPEVLVYNFGAGFVVPNYDAELDRLIDVHNAPKAKFDAGLTRRNIKAIFDRIKVLGGFALSWS